MKKLKDFFYNFNDIVIVLCILAIAALLILWRVDIIMRYPKTVAGQSVETSRGTKQTNSTTDSKSKTKSNTNKNNSSKKNSDNNKNSDNEAVDDGTVWKDGVLKNNMSVKVPQGAATDAVSALVKAGLFKSYDDFAALAEQIGLDPTSIMPGTYKFDAGNSQSDIIKSVLSN